MFFWIGIRLTGDPIPMLASVRQSIKSLVDNKWMLKQLFLRELHSRYRGTYLGMGWLVLVPIISVTIYTLVFGIVLKVRWGSEAASAENFALYLFPGLLVFTFFADVVNGASSIIYKNSNYVKKVVFPLPLLIFPPIMVAVVQLIIGLLIWLLLLFYVQGGIDFNFIYALFLYIPFLLLLIGISFILASLGVYFRDLGALMPLITQILMFLSPVLYPISAVPESIRFIYNMNPITLPAEFTRFAIYGEVSRVGSFEVVIYCIVALLVFVLGLIVFGALRKGFSDVL